MCPERQSGHGTAPRCSSLLYMPLDSPVARRRLLAALGTTGLLGATGLLAGCSEETTGRLVVKAAPPAPPSAPGQAAGQAAGQPSPSPSGLKPQYTLPTNDIALTFDDGPDPRWTPKVLDLLAQYKILATFFMIGKCAKDHPDLVAAVAKAGHEVANHTWDHHDPLGNLPPAAIQTEIEQTNEVLAGITGRRPTMLRAPGGDWNPASLAACSAARMRPVNWSVDPRDWSLPGTAHIIEVIQTKTKPGSIILEHDGDGGGNASRQQTVDALRAVLPTLVQAGYHFAKP